MNRSNTTFHDVRPITWFVWSIVPIVLAISLLIGVVIKVRSSRVARTIQDDLFGREASEGWLSIADRLNAGANIDEQNRWREIQRIASVALMPWIEAQERLDDREIVPTPGGDWALEPLAEPLIELSEPAVAMIERADQSSFPVWQNVLFEGIQTNVSEVADRSRTGQLLKRRFYIAIHRNEPAEAMRMLVLNRRVAATLDTQAMFVTELYRQITLSYGHQAIGESLRFDFWSPEQITQLRTMLQSDVPSPQHFRQVFLNEHLMWSATLNSAMAQSEDPTLDHLIESSVLRARYWDRVDRVANPQLDRDRQIFGGDSFLSLPTTGVELRHSFDSDGTRLMITSREFIDRIAIVDAALATKEYWMSQGRRPTSVQDLTTVGFDPQRLMATGKTNGSVSLIQFELVGDDQVRLVQRWIRRPEQVIAMPESSDNALDIIVSH